MTRVRWGVIGGGGIARRRTIPEGILRAANSELAGVFDPACGDAVARQFGTRTYDSVEEMLSDDGVDAVYIATPVHLHAEQAIATCRAGKHVLCEKPLALDMNDARRIVAAAAGVRLGVGLMMRFHAAHQLARRMIDDGVLGTPVYGRAQLSCWYPPIPGAWRQDPSLGGGGAVMDLAAHCIDLLEMFLGRTQRLGCSIARRVHDYPVEDTAVIMLEFAGGARGTVDCLFNVPDAASQNRLELYGSQGSLLAEGTIGQSAGGTMLLHGQAATDYDAAQLRPTGTARPISFEPVNLYEAEVNAFAAAVIEGRNPPVDGEAGLWNQRVLGACYEAAASGRMIDV